MFLPLYKCFVCCIFFVVLKILSYMFLVSPFIKKIRFLFLKHGSFNNICCHSYDCLVFVLPVTIVHYNVQFFHWWLVFPDKICLDVIYQQSCSIITTFCTFLFVLNVLSQFIVNCVIYFKAKFGEWRKIVGIS